MTNTSATREPKWYTRHASVVVFGLTTLIAGAPELAAQGPNANGPATGDQTVPGITVGPERKLPPHRAPHSGSGHGDGTGTPGCRYRDNKQLELLV